MLLLPLLLVLLPLLLLLLLNDYYVVVVVVDFVVFFVCHKPESFVASYLQGPNIICGNWRVGTTPSLPRGHAVFGGRWRSFWLHVEVLDHDFGGLGSPFRIRSNVIKEFQAHGNRACLLKGQRLSVSRRGPGQSLPQSTGSSQLARGLSSRRTPPFSDRFGIVAGGAVTRW